MEGGCMFKRIIGRVKDDEPHAGEVLTTYGGITFWAPKPISNEEYQRKRKAQADWLEDHYDLNSIRGVQSIPVSKNLPKYPHSGSMDVTGDVDYYLRQKASEHEANGNIELAIVCLRKSNAIRMVKRIGYRKDDYYALVRMLARNGKINEAYTEKEAIDKFFEKTGNEDTSRAVERVLSDAKDVNTDLVIMDAHGSVCPECAKYQGRVFSLSGASRKFPKIPNEFYTYGAIHPGCTHQFWAYIDGVTDPQLSYTLLFYKGMKWRYRRNIVAFSNRPFVDDRAKKDIEVAEEHHRKLELEAEQKRIREETMIEREAQRGEEARAFLWLQKNIPDKCPKSISGFRRMKKQNTKNYQKLTLMAKELGYEI